MTTIVYHRPSKTIAADRRTVATNGMIVGPRTKIGSLEGHLFAVCGDATGLSVVEAWIRCEKNRGGHAAGAGDEMKECDAIVVRPDGTVLALFGASRPLVLDDDFIAMGSGAKHAFTAMDMGASAQLAVHMAAKRDPSTGDGIDRIVMGGEIERITFDE